jgi:glycosyltransferase involved in cell wall biosynthesis
VLHALDIFVLLGAGSDESCRAALEAMAAGRPVVAARVGALSEAVVHGETGILLEQVSSEHVAAALRRLIEHPHEARAMGEAGHRRALGRFSPDSHARRFEEIYMAALTSSRQIGQRNRASSNRWGGPGEERRSLPPGT